MKPSFSQFPFEFTLCPTCSAPTTKENPFCNFCFQTIAFEISKWPPQPIFTKNHKVWALFRWDESTPRLITNLVYALKGGGHSPATLWLAKQFALKFGSLEGSHKTIRFLVPAPPAPGFGADHASEWSEALANTLSGAVWAPTQRILADPRAQKSRSAGERARAEHALRRQAIKNTCKIRHEEVAFCDDVYTTGATASATLRRLPLKKEPRDVFVIAYRAKLYRASMDNSIQTDLP